MLYSCRGFRLGYLVLFVVISLGLFTQVANAGYDACPDNPNKTEPGQCGCDVPDTNSDSDPIADCNDLCPLDSKKIEPQVCGCGIHDEDSDNDGTMDCVDNCPSDPGKIIEGQCGCGVSDLDSDQDGTANCNDFCPNHPLKTTPGTCGCGFPDTDLNQNQVADCQEDCNRNEIPDICDINPLLVPGLCQYFCSSEPTENRGTASLFGEPNPGCGVDEECSNNCATESDECNGNLIPDSCDPDSDEDGITDECDLCPSGVNTNSDNDPVLDCNDGCPLDSNKIAPGTCGCGVPDVDANQNGVLDCNETEGECFGLCVPENPELDEDEDQVSNCTEIEDGTDPCDRGSFIERLQPLACAGPNGYFQQWNILTVINQQLQKSLKARVEYRNRFGSIKGTVNLVLKPEEKRDVIVNGLGLEHDTYGTVCVSTNATKDGAWSGGLTLYKERFDSLATPTIKGLGPKTIFDYALYYPLTNPIQGASNVSLNTNTVGTGRIPGSVVANWIRLTDANTTDGKGLFGKLFYYDSNGKLVGSHTVSIPNGGRYDFGAHEKIGKRAVGMAEFKPSKRSAGYYIESSRYVYEGPVVEVGNFWTAYTIPNKPTTGVPTVSRLSTLANEIATVELINAAASKINASFTVFNASGGTVMNEKLKIAPKASRHLLITGNQLPAGLNGSGKISGPPESIGAVTLIYRFLADGTLLHAFAPSAIEPVGSFQRTEFNSFIAHTNTLDVTNSLDSAVTASVRVLDFDSSLVESFSLNLPPHGTKRRNLVVPKDTYGTVVVESGSVAGLVIRNDVSRMLEYTLSFPGK